MKYKVFGMLAFILLLGSYSTAAPAQTATAPRVEIEQVRYAFQPVVEGTQVNHTFSVRNVGDAPLIIKNIRTG